MSSRKLKIPFEEIVDLVEQYLNSQISISEASRIAGVVPHTFKTWLMLYENNGPSGLLPVKKNNYYSPALKLSAVQDYQDGLGSLYEITKKYGLRNTTQLSAWIKAYNTHKDFKSVNGGHIMSTERKTTLDERLEMVLSCIKNQKNYSSTAAKYQVSYQNVYYWVQKYEKLGKAGLEDRRGHRKGTLPSRTPEELLQDELARLKRENLQLQMELDIAKKLQEVERRNRYRK